MEDMISRKALCEYALNQKDKSVTPNDIMRFPSAQPKKRTEERTETHGVCLDAISRQAAIDALAHKWDGMVTSVFDVINSLPSAQPDVPDTNVGDMISRQAAIDALDGNVIVTSRENAQAVMDYIRECADRIRSLPSAQPDLDSAYSEGYTAAESKYRAMWDEMQANIKEKAFGKRKGLIHTADIDAMSTIKPERPSGREVYRAGYAEGYKAGQEERKKMSNKEWVDFLSEQFTVSRTSAREMLHGLMRWKAEDNFKKQFSGGRNEKE